VVQGRELAWRASTGKVAYRPGEFTAEDLDTELGRTPPIGFWLDTSALTAQETVEDILRRQSQPVVDARL
jgi:hypothetical protein